MAIMYDTKKIRTLLTEGFSPEDLRRFSYDDSGFRPVYHELSENPGKTKIIDCLIKHAEQTLQMPKLLDWAKEHNPVRYAEHEPYTVSAPQQPQTQETIDIFSDILDPSIKLSVILRKVKLLTYKSKNETLNAWLEKELNGYDVPDGSLPDYRQVSCRSQGEFVRGRVIDIELPQSEKGSEWAYTAYVKDSVSEIELSLENHLAESFQQFWTQELTNFLSSAYEVRFIRAWKIVTRAHFAHVLEGARNKLLTLLLEAQKKQ